MAYCTAAQIRAYLTQLTAADDALLTTIAARATGVVDAALGRDIRFTGYTTGTKTIYQNGTRYVSTSPDWCATRRVTNASAFLRVPPYDLGSITSITDDNNTAITDYVEAWDYGWFHLWREDTWSSSRYTIDADFGYGLPPDEIVEVAIEVAINIWRSKDRGLFSDVVGVEAAGEVVVGYQGALTNQQKMVIDRVARRYREYVI